jgi:sugar diacid utilization regulator
VDHPFTVATKDLIIFISGIISLELQKDKLLLLNDGMKYEHFYIELLKGKSLSDHDVNKILNHLHYSKENHYFLIVINSPVLSNYSYELTYLKTKILTFIKTDFCVIYEGNIILVVESSSESFLAELAFSKFKELLSISCMFAGISRPFHTLEDVKRGYSEAKKAVELGLKMNSDGRIFEYKDFQFYHLLDLCANQEEVRNLCHPALLDLIEHHYELSTTLYLYLKNGKSQAKTAKELHIQRSSLLYRLRKIEELLAIKLDDYQSLLHIQLSYEILNYLDLEPRQYLNPFHIG